MLLAEKQSVEDQIEALAEQAEAGADLRTIERELKRLVRPVNVEGHLVIVPKQALDALDVGALDAKARAERTFDIAAANAISAKSIMDYKRGRKRQRYLQVKANPQYRGPRILAEGDSWIEYPCAKDNGEWLGERYAFLSLAKAAATWADIIAEQRQHYEDGTPKGLMQNIAIENPHIVFLSVGGNEIIGNMATFVKPYQQNRPARDYITSDFGRVLNYVIGMYETRIGEILSKGCSVILHGYDYPDPRLTPGGQWIAPRLLHGRGIDDVTLWREIPNIMLREFARRMLALANTPTFGGKVHFVNLLGTIGTEDIINGPDRALWEDEIHGSTSGFQRISAKIAHKIDEVWQQIRPTT